MTGTLNSVVEDNIEKRTMDNQAIVVVNKANFLNLFIKKLTLAGSSRPFLPDFPD